MSYKRGRPTSPSTAQKRSRGPGGNDQDIKWGTPIPQHGNDRGSFVPEWQQTATDERGRRRFHGAFEGGFSAGYFNTAGSKEGFTPQTFVSSRTNRAKDNAKPGQRPEDFMDDEDLTQAAASRTLETTSSFAAVGSAREQGEEHDGLFGLMLPDEDTMAVKILQKMKWRKGQGIGPRVRRHARFDKHNGASIEPSASEQHLFAPEDTQIVVFGRQEQSSRKGLGYQSEARPLPKPEDGRGLVDRTNKSTRLKKPASKKTGLGVGILNDNGSDDDDPYEIGPKMFYRLDVGKTKKAKKPSKFAKPGAEKTHTFNSKSTAITSTALTRASHDGRPVLGGFQLASNTLVLPSRPKFPPPSIPAEWKSAKSRAPSGAAQGFQSVADAAKNSTLNAKARANLIGEASLPSKSIFDYMTKESRDRLAAITGNHNLPPGRGEALPQKPTEATRLKQLWSFVPHLDKTIAAAALNKGATGFMPYAEDANKRSRYIGFLELCSGSKTSLPERHSDMSVPHWAKELQEFADAARVFKPIHESMASRFASSSQSSHAQPGRESDKDAPPGQPAAIFEDIAVQAARAGQYGPATRSSIPFLATPLMYKRFNVKRPAGASSSERFGADATETTSTTASDDLFKKARDVSRHQRPSWMSQTTATDGAASNPDVAAAPAPVDPETNSALMQTRASDEVFRAIFGDDSEGD
ncbi:DUF1604-domain-containing protein [Polyplosphaeria fusca]|uniref:DUF1604-domain-containing protein n=1 Tax=Polyplosphaeria fusca TaxID=682080 RepID=A0A9P4V866_9PLEO|nr:DUF1604-domain-containing protein [Polyplosphaeria fusca]